MNDLKYTSNIVKMILEEDQQARNSDRILYLKVLEYISEKEGFALGFMTVPFFLTSMKAYGFPGFETVRRARQKIQAERPDLASDKRVAAMRMENEKIFRAYANGGDPS